METFHLILGLMLALSPFLIFMGLSYTSPVGGHVYTNAVAIPVGQWDGNWTGRPADVTQTDGGGGSSYRGFVQDPEWSFMIFLDDASFSLMTAAAFGTQMVPLAFRYGAGNKCSIVTGSMSLGPHMVLNANGDPIGVTVAGKGGTVLHNQNLPS